jgi:HSP20 family molecular chaperone IbpA
MFKKKTCKNCGEKINEKYNFCPYCRVPLNEGEDWGMLGKNDFMSPMEEMRLPMGLNTIFNSLMNNLNKQFNELDRDRKEEKKSKIPGKKGGISISISTSGKLPPEIKVKSFGDIPEFKEKEKKMEKKGKGLKIDNLKNKSKKFAGLPKEEPITDIRRFSNRVVYEIEMPGVKSMKDVSIIQLENSIEIKALAKDKVYSKLIPINLPIRDYNLEKGKLVLELEARD